MFYWLEKAQQIADEEMGRLAWNAMRSQIEQLIELNNSVDG